MDVNVFTIEQEIRLTLHLLISVIRGSPIAADITNTLSRLNLHLNEFVAMGPHNGQLADDLCCSLIRARSEALATLSSPVFMGRPNMKEKCKKLIDQFSSLLVQHCPIAQRSSPESESDAHNDIDRDTSSQLF